MRDHIVLCLFLLVFLPKHHHHLLLASPSTSSFSCRPDQRDALLGFIRPFSITDSYCLAIPYPNVASWREDQDCCSWDGVTCDNSTGYVIGLDLTCARLQGSIDSGSPLFSLRRLRSLSLALNDLLGSAMPPEIGAFTQLEYLDLLYSNISGFLPTEISQLSNLVSLNLSMNFRGLEVEDHTMRMMVGNLSQLEELNLRMNNMSKVDPTSFMNLSSSLVSLNLFNCSLGGKFPEHIFGLPNLQVIDISRNFDLTGTLPKSKWSPKLDYLSLGDCSFTGDVPSSIGNNSLLTYLDLSENNFTGELDLGILSAMENLYFLDLSGISISREEAYHETNIIKGSIPLSICRRTSLAYIYLTGCHLTGTIPQCMGNLTKLQVLSLSNNSLSGSLPLSLANCSSLADLDVGKNNISGGPPTWLFTLSISSINLRANNFEGRWPSDIFLRSASLSYIDLSGNKFEGPLPLHARAIYYSVSNNHFSGNLSSLICNATNLQYLDLSYNSLIGTLPHCLNASVHLRYLNVRENEFGGKIPEIFHEGSLLTLVDLSRNQFEGSLPGSLFNCKSLGLLDVGSNRITGSFPNWLGNLPLKVLSLRSNRFHGHINISKETHSSSQIRILDLSHNSFDGSLQDEFISKMFGMTRDDNYDFLEQYMHSNSGIREFYSVKIVWKGVEIEMLKINVRFAMLDLSSNLFRGEIPINIGELKSLKGLNLSHNGFTGSIPPSVGSLTQLDSLDLSSNHLMGEIPKELAQLTFLGFLDLSWNNLTGPIPPGGHFNTFSNSSFLGNPGLCGIPLTRLCDKRIAQPPTKGKDGGEEGRGWLEWKYVASGFGSGMGMGISLGYMVLEMGRPLWLVRVIIRLEASYRKMSKRKGAQRRNGRR